MTDDTDDFRKQALKEYETAQKFMQLLDKSIWPIRVISDVSEPGLDFIRSASEQFVKAIRAAAENTAWWREGTDTWDELVQMFSPEAVVNRTQQLAQEMWERADKPSGITFWDFWWPAQKHVVTLIKASITPAQSAVRIGNSLAPIWEAFSPVVYLELIGKLADCMSQYAGRTIGTSDEDFWYASEEHLRAIAAGAVRRAESSVHAGRALANIKNDFSPILYLNQIQKVAYSNWEKRGGLFSWAPLYALQDWVEAETQVRREYAQGRRALTDTPMLPQSEK